MSYLSKVKVEAEGNPEFKAYLNKAFQAYNTMDDALAKASVRCSGEVEKKFKAARAKLDKAIDELLKLANAK